MFLEVFDNKGQSIEDALSLSICSPNTMGVKFYLTQIELLGLIWFPDPVSKDSIPNHYKQENPNWHKNLIVQTIICPACMACFCIFVFYGL